MFTVLNVYSYPLQSVRLWSKALFNNKRTTAFNGISSSPPDVLLDKEKSVQAIQTILQKIDSATLDFSLNRKISSIPHAGLGVFLNGSRQKRGSILCFYPGTLYLPSDPILLVSLSNQYILKCFDGIYVDGKSTGLSRRIYQSIYKRENWPGAIQISDETWLETQDNQLANPLALGQYVNNGTSQYTANVCYHEVDLPGDFPMYLKKYIPNMYWNTNQCSSTDPIRIVALIALQDILPNQELFSTYMDII